MTISVYRINPETGVRTPVREKHTVKPVQMAEVGQKYPPCACTRCESRPEILRTKLAEVNRRSRGEL
ncbi:hypothetical protein [Streptomyces sp. NPDC051677]|uniref:hypothetical protein n=1 Tax=Streptomyces sp. NPDC051677 TaxID=3365669 RepID=UPI0037CF1DA4